MTLRLAALCAGYGGLELGLTHAGIHHTLAWYAESDPHASKVMAHNHPGVPNYGDLTKITDPPQVDIVTAGFPCQPFSSAGLQQGINDERWLIDDIVALWRRTGARWLILENVPGLSTANRGEAFGRVLDALTEVGASAEWTHLRASDIGAPHRRERWFCIAEAPDTHSDPTRRNPRTTLSPQEGWKMNRSNPTVTDLGMVIELLGTSRAAAGMKHPLRNPDNITNPRGRLEDQIAVLPTPTKSDGSREWTTRPTDTCLNEAVHTYGEYAAAVERWEQLSGRTAPEPTADGRLNPVFVEWMMGLAEGHVTNPAIGLSRPQQLTILGNGVVPQQAAEAFIRLTDALNAP